MTAPTPQGQARQAGASLRDVTGIINQAAGWMRRNPRPTAAAIAAAVADGYGRQSFKRFREAQQARDHAIAAKTKIAEAKYHLMVDQRGGQALSADEIRQLQEEFQRDQQLAAANHAPRVEEGAERERTLFGAIATVAALAYGWRRGLNDDQRTAVQGAVRHPVDAINAFRRNRLAPPSASRQSAGGTAR